MDIPDPEIRKEVARRIKKELLALNLPMKINVRSGNDSLYPLIDHVRIIFFASRDDIAAIPRGDLDNVCVKYCQVHGEHEGVPQVADVLLCIHKSYL